MQILKPTNQTKPKKNQTETKPPAILSRVISLTQISIDLELKESVKPVTCVSCFWM